jgi:cytochrome P450
MIEKGIFMKIGNSSLGKNIFLPKFSSIRYKLMATAANEAGGTLSVKYYGRNVVIISDPVLGREIHTKYASSLMRGGLPYLILRTLMGVGPLTANGIEWLDYRQDLNPSLSESAVSPYLPSLVGSYVDCLNRWIELAKPGPISIRRDDILHTVYSVVSRLVFGFDIDDRVGLCYDYGFNEPDTFEICYYDIRHDWTQIRTYL